MENFDGNGSHESSLPNHLKIVMSPDISRDAITEGLILCGDNETVDIVVNPKRYVNYLIALRDGDEKILAAQRALLDPESKNFKVSNLEFIGVHRFKRNELHDAFEHIEIQVGKRNGTHVEGAFTQGKERF